MFGYVRSSLSDVLPLISAKRCTELLKQTVNSGADHALDERLHPNQFSDDPIRLAVEELQLRYQENLDKPAKRLKISHEVSQSNDVAQQISEVLQTDLDCEHEAAFKTAFLLVETNQYAPRPC